MKDRTRQDMQDKDQLLYQELNEKILGSCFDYTQEFIILLIMPLAILLILFLYFRNTVKRLL